MARRALTALVSLALCMSCGSPWRKPELPRLLENRDATYRVDIGSGGHGSGVVVSEYGYILTCRHVAGDGAETLSVDVVEQGGKVETYPAKVIGFDPVLDLAVIKIPRRFSGAAVVEYPANVNEGDQVYNVGYPYSFGKIVGRGYVMKLHFTREASGIVNAMLVDMPDGPGTSGSGVYAAKSGKLIGIMKMMLWVGQPGVPPMVVRVVVSTEDVRGFLTRFGIPYRSEYAASQPSSAPATVETLYTIEVRPRAKAH